MKRIFAAELLDTGCLLMILVGSGIGGKRLAEGNAALEIKSEDTLLCQIYQKPVRGKF